MSKNVLRSITVNGEEYYWRVRHYYDSGEGRLLIYSAKYKAGNLDVNFTYKDRLQVFPHGAVYKWTGELGLPGIQQPIMTVRIIRYARNQLDWIPQKNAAPFVFENGYALLKQIGYEPVPNKVQGSC